MEVAGEHGVVAPGEGFLDGVCPPGEDPAVPVEPAAGYVAAGAHEVRLFVELPDAEEAGRPRHGVPALDVAVLDRRIPGRDSEGEQAAAIVGEGRGARQGGSEAGRGPDRVVGGEDRDHARRVLPGGEGGAEGDRGGSVPRDGLGHDPVRIGGGDGPPDCARLVGAGHDPGPAGRDDPPDAFERFGDEGLRAREGEDLFRAKPSRERPEPGSGPAGHHDSEEVHGIVLAW